MKIFFNTKAFEHHYSEISVTEDAAQAEILVLGAKKVPIEDFTRLKAVYRFGVGTENVPFDYLRSRGILVYLPCEQTKAILYDSTANFTAWLILFMHFSPKLGSVVDWKKQSRDYLGGKKLLVLGRGNIGARVAEKMKQFMAVSTYDKLYTPGQSIDSMIQEADFVSLHIPATPENFDFIDKRRLSLMKNDCVLINTARGALVNELALYERLVNTKMRAAFDVFWAEPYQGELSKLPKEKFFMTPHISSETREFVESGFIEIKNIISEVKKS